LEFGMWGLGFGGLGCGVKGFRVQRFLHKNARHHTYQSPQAPNRHVQVSAGASKSLFQARLRTVEFPKKTQVLEADHTANSKRMTRKCIGHRPYGRQYRRDLRGFLRIR